MTRPIALLALLLGSGIALAAPGWSAFEPAFPMFPCSDGWSACLVGGQAITPDMTRDTTGSVTPSDLRVGWFDLQPTAAFSPFTSLSVYPTANATDAAADAEAQKQADEARRKSEQASEEKRQAEEAARKAAEEGQQADAEAKRAAQERAAADAAAKAQAEAARKAQEAAAHASADQKAKLEAEAKAQALAQQKAEADAKAKAAEQARLEADQKAKKEAADKAAADAAQKAAAEAAQKKAEDDARKAAADAAAKKAAEDAARQAAAPTPTPASTAPGTTGGDAAADASIQAPTGPADCSSLTDLEPVAMLGKMSDGQVASCQTRLQAEAKMTDKDKISRVLMANAWAKGDKKEWEKLAKYHLEEIDQSDPDLCYKYALRLASGGVSRAPGVIHWADAALENRTVWTGDEYVSKVYGLYKMKAAAAQQMWAAAESAHAANPTDESAKKVEDSRNQTKVYAREWYEYAKASGKDKTPAQQLCMSAAGTADYCEGE